jgi:outer membrane murein-binding lipoprotein Lpp
LRGLTAQRLTTKEVRKEPALPHATRTNHRPGVVLVPTFHVQETRPFRDSLSSDLDDLSSRVDDLEGNAGSVSVDDLSSTVDDLSSTVDDLSSRFDDLCFQLDVIC